MIVEADRENREVYFSYFHRGLEDSGKGKLSWWNRIRYACRCLFVGKPYTDMVILSEESVSRLCLALQCILSDISAASIDMDTRNELERQFHASFEVDILNAFDGGLNL
jgi:hypothetical protein